MAFDRTAHCQRIGAHGGATTLQRHGTAHYRMIGKAGARATITRHGVAYFAGLVKAKGWAGPRPKASLAQDLALGATLAALNHDLPSLPPRASPLAGTTHAAAD